MRVYVRFLRTFLWTIRAFVYFEDTLKLKSSFIILKITFQSIISYVRKFHRVIYSSFDASNYHVPIHTIIKLELHTQKSDFFLAIRMNNSEAGNYYGLHHILRIQITIIINIVGDGIKRDKCANE